LSGGGEINNKHIINIIRKYLVKGGIKLSYLIDYSKSSTDRLDG
jgi:hypothetical protein